MANDDFVFLIKMRFLWSRIIFYLFIVWFWIILFIFKIIIIFLLLILGVNFKIKFFDLAHVIYEIHITFTSLIEL